jgi:putative hydrolases of HD superfamily
MKQLSNLLFEAKILKFIPRSGFPFLGAGRESVAEHSFSVTFIGYVLSRLVPGVDALRLISMCLVHDLPEARTGDLNYVNKKYVAADEHMAIRDAMRHIPFGDEVISMVTEFRQQETLESLLAHDADQLAFILDLKSISDTGHTTPEKWIPVVRKRLKTDIGRQLAEAVLNTSWDAWWMDGYTE